MILYDIPSVLKSLGIREAGTSGNELKGSCPGHEERTGHADANPSWYINVSTGAHICFSCGFKGNLPQLVASCLKLTDKWGALDYGAAQVWLEQFDGVPLDLVVDSIAEEAYAKPSRVLPMRESRLALYTEPPEWALEARRLTAGSAYRYGVLWDSTNDSWITPFRDPFTGALVGWQEKSQGKVINGCVDPNAVKIFRNRPAGVKKSHLLFGFDRQAPSLHRAVVVESPLDAVRLMSAGVQGGVAIGGSNVSEEQLYLLRKFDQIIVAVDNPRLDKAGRIAALNFLELSSTLPDLLFFNYGQLDDIDVGTMSDLEISRGVLNARHSVFGKEAIGL